MLRVMLSLMTAITFGMIFWLTGLGEEYWYLFIIVGISFVFSLVPLIIRFFKSKSKIDANTGFQPYQPNSSQPNIIVPMNHSQSQETYQPVSNHKLAYCTYCGGRVKPNNSFCENCGKAIGK